jgi:flagellar biosynthesis/type III secretory pathway protein FliH
VSSQLGALALSVARQVIGREIDAESHRALIDEAVAALRASADTTAARSQS